MMRRTLAACALALVGAATLAAPALGAPPDSCTFTAVSGVNFGNYDVLNALPSLSNGSLTYNCTNFPAGGETVTIFLSKGNSATYSPRHMLNGLQNLTYNLYLDAGLTKIWGNGAGGSLIYGPVLTLNNTPATVTIFGRIPAAQDVGAGAYSDTITATINW